MPPLALALDAVEVLCPSVEAAVLLALLEPEILVAKGLLDKFIRCALAVVLTRCFTSSLEMAADADADAETDCCCISLNDFVGALDAEMILAGSG